MNPPSPAIVAQNAVRSLPRWIMLLLCATYVLAGFVGREPWREVDMAAFGFMQSIAQGSTTWTQPLLDGMKPQAPGLLQYWLGAWSLQLLPSGMPADLVVRLPFMLLLALALWCTWRGVFSLARTPGAQPVMFAFGGEASPTDYARAMADGGLLALMACLGLAQLSHETSHTLVQLSALCTLFFAAASMWWQPKLSAIAALLGLLALALAGAPSMAMMVGAGAMAMALFTHPPKLAQRYSWAAWWALSMAVAAAAAWLLGLWEYRLINPWMQGKDWQSVARLLMWFSWPAWLLALWALWRWRRQLQQPTRNPHLFWPLWLWGIAVFCTIFTLEGDRSLILALPGIAALAAFALPTFKRSLGALIDWLTLFFFTISAITIWVVWISVQTGFPAKPAENVQRLAVGFEPSFALFPFLVAVAATVGWLLLVAWRTRRHRAAIWKSLAVPAGGTALGWVLLMTLWLPMLDYARSYAPHVQAVVKVLPNDVQCVHTLGFGPGQNAAMRFHSNQHVVHGLPTTPTCDWLIATPAAWSAQDSATSAQWQFVEQVTRPTDRRDHLLVLRRAL
jgi:4-amino-4-deoxy-L-arabinose transferase-like glycosyltransferase